MSNALIYIVETTTNDPWEMCGGTYLVRSANKEQAGKDVISYLNDQNKNVQKEVVSSVKRYYKSEQKYDVELLQEPIVQ